MDKFFEEALNQARKSFQEGGIPKVVIGENRTFMGSEDLLRSRDVEVVVLTNPECIGLMQAFTKKHPEVWNEDIGEEYQDR